MPSLLKLLRSSRRCVLHCVDPFKVGIDEAISKSKVLKSLGSPILIVGSTDNNGVDTVVPDFVAGVSEKSELPIVTHFPPVEGRGHPVFAKASGFLATAVFTSSNEYYRLRCLEETRMRKCVVSEPLITGAVTIGRDSKSAAAVHALPLLNRDVRELLRLIREADIQILYLYSRNDAVPASLCRYLRSKLCPEQLIFVSGGITSKSQVRTYLSAGADYVVVGTALEHPNWQMTALQLFDTNHL